MFSFKQKLSSKETGGVGEGEAGQTNGGMSSNAGASVSTEMLEEDGELALIDEPSSKDGCQMMTTPTQQTTQTSQTLSFLLITLSLLCLFSNHKRRLLSDLS